MFSHYRLYDSQYFKIIRKTDYFVEVMSLNTQHCWIIQKKELCLDENRYWLYHKHKPTDQYYHLHAKLFNVSNAVSKIRYHDFNTINRKQAQKDKK